MKKLAALLIALNVVAMTAATYSSPRPADPYAADIALTGEYKPFSDNSTLKSGYKHNDSIVIPAKYDFTLDFSEGLAAVITGGKYGFIDKCGNMVIPAKYDIANYFSEGLAAVLTGGKWGFIDKSGNMVIPARYDDVLYLNGVNGFKNGKAKVELNGRELFIDRNGNEEADAAPATAPPDEGAK